MRKNRLKQMITISVILMFLHIRRMMWAQQKMIDRNYAFFPESFLSLEYVLAVLIAPPFQIMTKS